MPIYLLALERDLIGYDITTAMVVRAIDEAGARKMAAQATGRERGSWGEERVNDWWLDPEKSECTLIPPDGPQDIVLRHFNAG